MDETDVRDTLTPAEVREQRMRERDEELAARLLKRGDVEALAAALTKARQKPKRARKANEPPEVAASIERQIKALVRRIGAHDIESLAYLDGLQRFVAECVIESVENLRTPSGNHQGYSWQFIGDVLHMTRQAAQEKFTRRAPGQPKRVRHRGRTPATVTPIRQETA